MGRVGVSKCRQLERDQEAEGPAGPLCEPGLGSSWPGPLLLPLCLGCREGDARLARGLGRCERLEQPSGAV